jgi:nucleotide-binding universal stress UspA family protein
VLFQGYRAVVLTVWEPFAELMAQAGANPVSRGVPPGIEEIDQANHLLAEDTAREGAHLAQTVGFEAAPRTCRRVGSIADVILSEAKRRDVSAIVMGSKGHGGPEPFFLGGVSHAVLQRADRAVLVIPSPPAAHRRSESLRTHAWTGA